MGWEECEDREKKDLSRLMWPIISNQDFSSAPESKISMENYRKRAQIEIAVWSMLQMHRKWKKEVGRRSAQPVIGFSTVAKAYGSITVHLHQINYQKLNRSVLLLHELLIEQQSYAKCSTQFSGLLSNFWCYTEMHKHNLLALFPQIWSSASCKVGV